MMTGHGDVPTAVAAMKLGAFHFVEKPFDAEELLGVVEEALARTSEFHNSNAELLQYRKLRASLTQREEEVFLLLLEGLSDQGDRRAAGNHLPNDGTSPRRRHAQVRREDHFPPDAHGLDLRASRVGETAVAARLQQAAIPAADRNRSVVASQRNRSQTISTHTHLFFRARD